MFHVDPAKVFAAGLPDLLRMSCVKPSPHEEGAIYRLSARHRLLASANRQASGRCLSLSGTKHRALPPPCVLSRCFPAAVQDGCHTFAVTGIAASGSARGRARWTGRRAKRTCMMLGAYRGLGLLRAWNQSAVLPTMIEGYGHTDEHGHSLSRRCQRGKILPGELLSHARQESIYALLKRTTHPGDHRIHVAAVDS